MTVTKGNFSKIEFLCPSGYRSRACHARPSHALLHGIYWQIGFPTCWCAGRLPADVASRIAEVYRAEIARAMPLALDDRAYRAELAYAAATWLFSCISWDLEEALKEDSTWGTWSIRGRLLWYLHAVIDMTACADVLPGINGGGAWLAVRAAASLARRVAARTLSGIRNELCLKRPLISAPGHSCRFFSSGSSDTHRVS
jgi:hypothetical protein